MDSEKGKLPKLHSLKLLVLCSWNEWQHSSGKIIPYASEWVSNHGLLGQSKFTHHCSPQSGLLHMTSLSFQKKWAKIGFSASTSAVNAGWWWVDMYSRRGGKLWWICWFHVFRIFFWKVSVVHVALVVHTWWSWMTWLPFLPEKIVTRELELWGQWCSRLPVITRAFRRVVYGLIYSHVLYFAGFHRSKWQWKGFM